MDFDIAWFEPVFSPYLAWFGPSGVLSVSRALADRLGLGVPETMRAVDAALPCRAARADRRAEREAGGRVAADGRIASAR